MNGWLPLLPEKMYHAASQVRAQKLQRPVSVTATFLSADISSSRVVSPGSFSLRLEAVAP